MDTAPVTEGTVCHFLELPAGVYLLSTITACSLSN
jgi:hypothetical protein